jgi:conjugal transfer pilus assembly protein TraE
MDLNQAVSQSSVFRNQRNLMALFAVGAAVVAVSSSLVAFSRDREVILQPISRSALSVSSAGVSRDYLELVTRDVALLILNRSPENLEYWRDSILEITSTAQHGAVSRDLAQIIEQQKESSVAQYFTMSAMDVDTDRLSSEISGNVHTIVGSKEVTSVPRKFRFYWSYEGLSLKLKGFKLVTEKEESVQ